MPSRSHMTMDRDELLTGPSNVLGHYDHMRTIYYVGYLHQKPIVKTE